MSNKKILKGSMFKKVNGEILPGLTFSLNPEEISRDRDVVYSEINAPGKVGSRLYWVRTNAETISFDLLLAAKRSRGSVAPPALPNTVNSLQELPDLHMIESFANPHAQDFLSDQDKFVPPPEIILILGPRIWNCVLESYKVKEKIYTPDFLPILVEVSISLKVSFGSIAEITEYISNIYYTSGVE